MGGVYYQVFVSRCPIGPLGPSYPVSHIDINLSYGKSTCTCVKMFQIEKDLKKIGAKWLWLNLASVLLTEIQLYQKYNWYRYTIWHTDVWYSAYSQQCIYTILIRKAEFSTHAEYTILTKLRGPCTVLQCSGWCFGFSQWKLLRHALLTRPPLNYKSTNRGFCSFFKAMF